MRLSGSPCHGILCSRKKKNITNNSNWETEAVSYDAWVCMYLCPRYSHWLYIWFLEATPPLYIQLVEWLGGGDPHPHCQGHRHLVMCTPLAYFLPASHRSCTASRCYLMYWGSQGTGIDHIDYVDLYNLWYRGWEVIACYLFIGTNHAMCKRRGFLSSA